MVNYYNPYMMQGNYLAKLEDMKGQIDNQIQQIQQQGMPQMPMQQPTNLTQNFQLAPNVASNFKLVNNLDDVKKEIIIVDTYFLAKDNSQMWIKNPRGDIRTFNLEEIAPKDEKDLLIEQLQKEIHELKGGINNAKYNESNGSELYEQSNARYDEPIGEQIEANKSTNVSIVPDSKTAKYKSK